MKSREQTLQKNLLFQPHCALDTITNQHPSPRPFKPHISLPHQPLPIPPPPLKHTHLSSKPACSKRSRRCRQHPMTALNMLLQLVFPRATVPGAPRHRAAKDLGASLVDLGMATEVRLTAERAMAHCARWTRRDWGSDAEREDGRTLGRRDEEWSLCYGLFIGVKGRVPW